LVNRLLQRLLVVGSLLAGFEITAMDRGYLSQNAIARSGLRCDLLCSSASLSPIPVGSQ